MKKTVKNLSLVFIAMFTVIILVGCSNSKIDSKVIGTWNYDTDGLNSTYVFNKDATGEQTIKVGENSSKNKFTYETKEGKILITFENDSDVFEYKYRFEGKNLVLKDSFDEELIYKKK